MKKARKIFKVLTGIFTVLFIIGAVFIAGYADGNNIGYEEYELIGILIECIIACSTGFCYFMYAMFK